MTKRRREQAPQGIAKNVVEKERKGKWAGLLAMMGVWCARKVDGALDGHFSCSHPLLVGHENTPLLQRCLPHANRGRSHVLYILFGAHMSILLISFFEVKILELMK